LRLTVEPPVLDYGHSIAMDPQEVLRMMGVPKRGAGRVRNAPQRALDMYEELKDRAVSLVMAKSAYVLCRSDEVGYHEVFRKASHLAFAVCTIGPDLEAEVLRLAEGGSSLGALVLDAMGTVAVESVATETARRIRAEAEGLGLEAGVRFSPGYGKWPLSAQRFLFDIIDGGVVGVKLNPSCIMEPRKSISFAMRIGTRPDARATQRR
jgi:cobalamin-dependent methionine synthase I